jgi:hypothetical protein
MKKLILILMLVSTFATAQVKRDYQIKQDVITRSQTEIQEESHRIYNINCDTKNTAWKFYKSGEYENAIYYAKRISTNVNDGDYLYSQKTQILCLSYANIGDKKNAKKFFKKVKKKSKPSDVRYVEGQMKRLNIIK